jgi:dihydrofolate reductase
MRISLIVAMSENRVIGRQGQLPWRLSADLRRFKRLTMGHHIVMGRKTFESIGCLLPGRTSVVVTRQPDYAAEGAVVASDLKEALARCRDDDEVFIIGGAEIYRLALPHVHRIYLTRVHACIEGDTHFPGFSRDQWQQLETQHYPADEKNQYEHSFEIYDRIEA